MANAMPRITIEGDAELMALINSIPSRVLTECSKAMRKVAKPIIAHARGLLRRQHGLASGLLKKSIGVRALKTDRKKMVVYMYVGPRGPKQSPGFEGNQTGYHKRNGKYKTVRRKHVPLYIAHLVEFGHKIAGGGYVRPYPFLRPAVDANKGNFTQEMKEALRAALAKRAAKAGTK